MQMRPVTAVMLPANEVVEFKGGGLHLMLIGLQAPLAAGSSFPITFNFRSAEPITIQVDVVAPGDERAAH
jgi:copper(I)-binding protein